MSTGTPEPYASSQPHRGAWLVYLNGIEIPCPNVTVSYGVGMIPEATLGFVPHRLLQRLGAEDRLEVTVFYLDDLADPENPAFRLLFEGEIVGWRYVNTPGGRQISFNAVADISIFTQLYFFFMNTANAVVTAAATQGFGSDSFSEPGVYYPYSLFKKGLIFEGGKKPPPDIDRPFEILYNCVKGILQKSVNQQNANQQNNNDQRSIAATNFFAPWCKKRNFQNRFVALPVFEDDTTNKSVGVFPIFQEVQADFAMQAMQQNLASTIGQAGSILDVLKKVFSLVFFEIQMLPTAPCYKVRLDDGTILGPSDYASTLSKQDSIQKEPLRLANYFVKPQLIFGIAPTCNIIFPSMLSVHATQEQYISQPTRVYISDSLISQLLPQNELTANALTFAWPPEANAAVQSVASQVQKGASKAQVVRNGKNVLIFPEEFYKGPVLSRLPVPAWFQLLKNKEKAPPGQQSSPAQTDYLTRLQKLYELYAQYEFYRQRYERRGGTAELAWNPYMVPGFPCVVFDQRTSGFDTIGYLTQVTHTLSAEGGGSMRTSISYGFARTLQEMLDLLKRDFDTLNVVSGSAPAEPVTPVRDIIQDFTKAEQFYNALFFGRQPTPNKKASFDFREVVGYPNLDPTTSYEEVSVTPITMVPAPVTSGSSTVPVGAAFTNLDGTRDLTFLDGFKKISTDYNSAMWYVSRPICTLEDYIQFLHNETPIGTLIQNGEVEEMINSYGYDATLPNSAKYYKRIRKLRQGPGATPTPAQTNTTSTPAAGVTLNTGPSSGLPPTAPQTRADWDTVLLAYRDELLNRKASQL